MRPEDFDRFAAIWADPEVVRHIGGHPWDRRRAWESFLRNAGHWQMTGIGQWAITELSTRRMVGQVGFFYGANQLGEDFDKFPQAGWVLAREVQGSGYGWEAVHAAHDWHDRVMPGTLSVRITPDNTASLRLAEKLGYKFLRHAEQDGEALDLFLRSGPPGQR